jgi:hypothetical protein
MMGAECCVGRRETWLMKGGLMLERYRLHLISSVAGLFSGYLIFHPYTMLVYQLTHPHPSGELHYHWQELSARAFEAFKPMMLPMAMPFVLFAGVIGLLIGVLMDRNKRLYLEKSEKEKRQVAVETLKNLMVTLSHYLLNANMIIGGKVRHCRKVVSDLDVSKSLEAIEEQGRKIDAVIGALRKVTEIKTTGYTSDGSVQMIDIAKEIEDHLGSPG